MSKYKVGDKFIVEIKEVMEHKVPYENAYRIKNGGAFCITESVFDCMHKVDSNMKIEDIDDMIAEYDTEKKGYNRGLQDAWNAALKFSKMADSVREEVFDECNSSCFFKNIPPQEALAKLEAYEKTQEIQVGDVVICSLLSGVVTCVDDERVFVLYDDGSCGERRKSDLKKTGKHIHIHALLQEIGGE